MEDILTIPTVAGKMGLIAYECPKCGYVTSVLQQPEDGR
jgi:predicted nucleic acid-binding Zn ribbon protein